MSSLDVDPFMGALGNSLDGGGPLARLLPQPCTMTSLHGESIAAPLPLQSKTAYTACFSGTREIWTLRLSTVSTRSPLSLSLGNNNINSS